MFRVMPVPLMLGLVSVACFAQSSSQSIDPPPAPVPQQQRAGGSSSAEVAGHNSGEVGTSPPALSNLLGEALVLYRKGEFNAAISKYQDYLKDHPQSPDAVAGMVRVYLKQKKVDQAVQVAEQGLAHSDSPRIRVARAEVWFRQGRITEAENEWVKVINSGFQEARAYLGLGRVRNAIAMYKTGKRLLDKAHELDPDDPDIYEHWIRTLSRAERIKYLQNALAGENNWDADQRSSVASYLEYLNERAKRKNTSPCRLVSKVTGTETRLVRLLIDPQHLRGYGLDVFLNGHKSSLLLDTGASGILVKRSIAEHAGMSKITETKVWGIGNKGGRNAYRSIADSIKVGDLEFQNCPVEVMESSSVVGEDGLIGADVFEQFLVDLDFPNEKLRLSELPKRPSEAQQNLALNSEDDDSDDAEDTAEKPSDPKEASANAATANAKPASPPSGPQDRYIAPEMQSYTRILRFGHDLLIPTTIGNVPYKLFLMDTGAVMNAISPAAAREVTKVHNDDTTVRGISGKVDKVYSANKAVLSFGHLRQENQDMTAFDTTNLSDGIGTEISGFLGFVLLRFLDIKIDYRDALIDFQYDAKHWNR